MYPFNKMNCPYIFRDTCLGKRNLIFTLIRVKCFVPNGLAFLSWSYIGTVFVCTQGNVRSHNGCKRQQNGDQSRCRCCGLWAAVLVLSVCSFILFSPSFCSRRAFYAHQAIYLSSGVIATTHMRKSIKPLLECQTRCFCCCCQTGLHSADRTYIKAL